MVQVGDRKFVITMWQQHQMDGNNKHDVRNFISNSLWVRVAGKNSQGVFCEKGGRASDLKDAAKGHHIWRNLINLLNWSTSKWLLPLFLHLCQSIFLLIKYATTHPDLKNMFLNRVTLQIKGSGFTMPINYKMEDANPTCFEEYNLASIYCQWEPTLTQANMYKVSSKFRTPKEGTDYCMLCCRDFMRQCTRRNWRSNTQLPCSGHYGWTFILLLTSQP